MSNLDITLDLGEINKFVGRYSLGKDNGNGSLHFLRIKIPAGRVNAYNLREIASMSREYGRGYAEVTDRQDIHLHWIDSDKSLEVFERLYGLGYTTDMCGQGFPGACYGDVRNIVSCPLSGKINEFDIAEYAVKLTGFFSGNPDFNNLPKKFKIGIAACGSDCVRLGVNDLALIGVSGGGFTPLIGGGMGATKPGAMLARHIQVFVPENRVFDFVKAVVELHRDYTSRESKAMARFKNLAASWGVEKIRQAVEDKIGGLEDFHNLPEIRQDVHNGSGTQWDGLCYFTLPLIGGVLDADRLDKIAEISEKYGSGEVRLTSTQNVTFVDIENVGALKHELEKHFRLYTGGAFYNSIGCTSKFCGRTKDVHAKDMLSKFLAVLEKHRIKEDAVVHVSGCINACSCHQVAPFGLAGRQVKNAQVYDLYIGGDSRKLKMARLYRDSLMPQEAIKLFDELLSAYKSSGKSLDEFLEVCNGTEA